MAMITEDYVSFEVAKLLKEKGFEGECSRFYMPNGHGRWKYEHYHDFDIRERIDCPTPQMAMRWLREVHKLYAEIHPYPLDFKHEDIQDGWGCQVAHLSNLAYDDNYQFFQKRYDTYEEACEAAIKYCLEHLI